MVSAVSCASLAAPGLVLVTLPWAVDLSSIQLDNLEPQINELEK